MPTPKDEVSALFRSLGTEIANGQSRPAALTQEKQHWPLLQAITPKAAALSPALTNQEKARWTSPAAVNNGGKKPALSRPGLGDKFAKGLGKMVGRSPLSVKMAKTSAPFAPLPPPSPPSLLTAPPEPEGPTESKVPPTQRRQTLPSAQALTPRAQLFSTPPEQSFAAPLKDSSPVAQDDSLVAIFGRLAQRDLPASPPAAKKSSFLSHIGKK